MKLNHVQDAERRIAIMRQSSNELRLPTASVKGERPFEEMREQLHQTLISKFARPKESKHRFSRTQMGIASVPNQGRLRYAFAVGNGQILMGSE